MRTPKGIARYVTLDREEMILGKPTGNFSASIVFEGEALEAMRSIVEGYIQDTFPAKKAAKVNRPFKEDKETGAVYLKFSTKVKDRDGNQKTIPLLDSKGNPIRKKIAIGNGSIIKIEGSMCPTEYQGGDYVKLFLNKIKVVRLVEFVPGGDWRDDDDSDEDGEGYVADEFGDGEAPSRSPQRTVTTPEREPGDDQDEDEREEAPEETPKAPSKGKKARADF